MNDLETIRATLMHHDPTIIAAVDRLDAFVTGCVARGGELVARVTELEAALKPFARHRICEDSWYSCPMSGDGCSNYDMKGCICGAEQVIEVLNPK